MVRVGRKGCGTIFSSLRQFRLADDKYVYVCGVLRDCSADFQMAIMGDLPVEQLHEQGRAILDWIAAYLTHPNVQPVSRR